MKTYLLGTRGSDLALTQSNWVATRLREVGLNVEIMPITTSGDRTRKPLALLGGVGVFAAALREAIADGTCDFAVHSMKDLPTAPVAGLTIAAVPEREDPADVLILRPGLSRLPEGAMVGTGSPRRAAQLRALYPGVRIADLRGNVPTRIARADTDDLDAVVLAASGLHRLGWPRDGGVLSQLLGCRRVVSLPLLPAAAQGALAVETRRELLAADEDFAAAMRAISCADTFAAASAERGVLAALEAGCAAPVGALATRTDNQLCLTAGVFGLDGQHSVRCEQSVALPATPEEAARLGRAVADELLERGAGKVANLAAKLPGGRTDAIPAHAPTDTGPLAGRLIFVPRSGDDAIVDAIRAAGAAVVATEVIESLPLAFDEEAVAEQLATGHYSVVALTSARTVAHLPQRIVTALRESGAEVACVGPATASAATAAGLQVRIVGTHDAVALASEIGAGSGQVWLPCSALAKPTLARELEARGWQVTRSDIYTMRPTDQLDSDIASAFHRGQFDAIVITSGSVARALVERVGHAGPGTAVVTIGEPSATAVRAGGGIVAAIAPAPTPAGIVQALATAFSAMPGK